MIRLIERLVQNGCAYVAEDHVLFHVAAMKDYGKLSNRTLDEMVAGARVEVAPYKKDPMDFVLWKPSKPDVPGWDTPRQAPGRPGWHIECSAMSGSIWARPSTSTAAASTCVSAPRERDRAIALRLPYQGDGELLDAQRLLAGRRREDGEEPRQFRDDP